MLYVIGTASLQPLHAQEPTPTLGPILPTKVPATATITPTQMPVPKLEIIIVNYDTVPALVRAREPFDLHLDFKNVGTLPARDVSLENINCAGGAAGDGKVIISEGPCLVDLPVIEVGQTVHVKLSLRVFQRVNETGSDKVKEGTLPAKLMLKFKKSVDSLVMNQPFDVGIYFLPELTITDPTSVLERQFPKPNLIVKKTWTAKARATISELLTSVPLVINSQPIAGAGGPEFELVVELQNQGDAEAINIFINFCATGVKFNPVGSECRKYVPANLPRGANAVASQTLAYKADQYKPPPENSAPMTPPPVGETVTLTINYDYWYAGQLVKGSDDQIVYLYPQSFPAVTPTPTNWPTGAHLQVKADALNVRKGPSTDHPIIALVYRSGQFPINGRNADSTWWQIKFNDSLAWVSADADLVIATGAETVPVATNIPTPPPPISTQLLSPEPSSALLASSDIMTSELGSSPDQAEADPFIGGETLLVPNNQQAGQGNLIRVNQQSLPAQNPLPNAAGLSQAPLVVVEGYRTLPEQPLSDQPFQIEFILRNVGGVTAQQLALGWNSETIVPIGTGTMWWLEPLPPGERTTVAGQFAFVTPMSDSATELPIHLLYANANGQMAEHTEQIILLRQPSEQSGLSVIQPMQTPQRPLWLRILLGLVGLGAESP